MALAAICTAAGAVMRYRQYQASMKAHDFARTLSRMISSGVLEKRPSQLFVPREIRRGDVNIVHKVGESKGQIGEACLPGLGVWWPRAGTALARDVLAKDRPCAAPRRAAGLALPR